MFRSLDDLAEQIRGINAANGWNVTQSDEWSDPYKVPAVLCLINSEVSEALEAFRNGDVDNFREELADVLIRTLDLAAAFDPTIDFRIEEKLKKNKERGHRHGGKRI